MYALLMLRTDHTWDNVGEFITREDAELAKHEWLDNDPTVYFGCVMHISLAERHV